MEPREPLPHCGEIPPFLARSLADLTELRLIGLRGPRVFHLSPEALRRFCRERLAAYKIPVTFRRVQSLPRNAAGKLLRGALRAEP